MKASKYSLFKIICITFLISYTSIQINAQERSNNNLEKIYTQTDRPFYFPGETIWFKSYIVNTDNTIATLSDVMYAELISPGGSIVKTIKLAINQGYAYGDFTIDKDWVGGIYKLKMFTNWMRNFGDDAYFMKKITIQKIVKPNVLLSLKFEKEGYGKSSLVIANFEAKDLKNNPITNTELSYEVSIKGDIVITKNIKTNNEGKANLTFRLPKDLKTRDVVLNVQIPQKGTTESISRNVPVVLDNIDLQFFPESGKLLYGTENKVAFKAIDEFTKPVDIQGNIIDESGNIISSFDSFHDGMGAFNLNPALNKTYYAVIKAPFTSDKKIALPKIHSEGINFKVETDSLSAKIKLHVSIEESLYLQVLSANKVLLEQEVKPNQRSININTKAFPIGITIFRITDKDKTPLAERLVFINTHKQLKIDIKLDKEIYQTREKVNVTLTTKDRDNNPIPSNLSIAIVDNKLLSFADDKQDHILSYLLLSSELKGKIHEPNFYFNPEEEKSYQALDYVMLTHGWRDYITKPFSIKGAQYKPEQLTTQFGRTIDKKGNPVQAKLLLFDQNGNKVLVFESDEKGHFSFKFDKAQSLTLIAYTDDGQQLQIIEKEKLMGFTNNTFIKNYQNEKLRNNIPTKFNNPTQQKIKGKATTSVSLSEDSSNLDEVVVVAYGTKVIRKSVGASIVRVESEELSSNEPIGQLLRGRVAGVQVVNGSGIYGSSSTNVLVRGASSISGNNQPLIIVDGVPYDQETLSNLNTNEVDGITILKNAAATSLYGSRGSNGVIVITTRNQNFYNNWSKKKLNNAKYNNYAIRTFNNKQPTNLYYARQFYIPKYEGKDLPIERKDFRQTIYWNPIVQTNENGKATFEFYNSDAITSFQILTEGIGYNGLLGRHKKEFATKKLLNVDFKSPNYMVLNDTVILPVTITNETNKNIEALLNVELPDELKLLEPYKKNIFVKANSSTIEHIKIKPTKKAEKVIIKIDLKADGLSDLVEKEATILSPYFPTEISVSGSKSQSFEFSVDNLVDGSLNADFTIYTDIVGDVMDGIEGIIREPYGCFEQVSSSTYPNILVLKYLKETNKSNPEIEKLALSFIKKGYKKLAGYETRKDGFEWYGRTPPHEALTAYGLMQFTEMKEVFDGVSEPMLKRTINYLLSRRDGKGGFKQNRGKYGFSAAPEIVNNAYIVYAISESGLNTDIGNEYVATYKEALSSNDTYRMALVACASFNFGKEDNAKKLIDKIRKNIEAYGFSMVPVENTITRSYGNAKNIETVAFSLLALLKEKNPDDFLISKGIEYLVSKRRYNRFGSTQSTSMALKALIEYTKTQKAKLLTKDNSVELTINGKNLSRELSVSKNGKIVVKNLEPYITEGSQNLTVKFSNSEITFPYSLNITYDSSLPKSSVVAPLILETKIMNKPHNVGDNVSMTINVTNKKNEHLGMVTSIIGIPSGTTPQPWQLKKLIEENKVDYYEIFDNYLVFYWRSLKALETKTVRLDLKADISGNYQAPASTVYLYYGDEFKTWIAGNKVSIK